LIIPRCDIGFVAYNLHTDTQHLGYVLKDNETDVPEGLKNGLRAANIMQVYFIYFILCIFSKKLLLLLLQVYFILFNLNKIKKKQGHYHERIESRSYRK